MSSGSWQRKLLNSTEALRVPGVVYALVFAQQQMVYVGQTVNSAWHRWQQHVGARWKDAFESGLQKQLRDSRAAASVLVIPLEVIPMPGMMKEGHHTAEFIQEFRRRALVREREWIRLVSSSRARLLNLAKEKGNQQTKSRRERRAKTRMAQASDDTWVQQRSAKKNRKRTAGNQVAKDPNHQNGFGRMTKAG